LRRARGVDLDGPLVTFRPRPAATARRRHAKPQHINAPRASRFCNAPELQRIAGQKGDHRAAGSLNLARTADGERYRAGTEGDAANALAFSVAANGKSRPTERGD
jgi:hypothetical protein